MTHNVDCEMMKKMTLNGDCEMLRDKEISYRFLYKCVYITMICFYCYENWL